MVRFPREIRNRLSATLVHDRRRNARSTAHESVDASRHRQAGETMRNIRTTRIRTSTVVLMVFGLTVAQFVRVQAQQSMNTDRHTAAQAAAYKALYTCSGLFDAGLTEQRLQDDIFSGIRAQLKQAMVGMRAVVDEKSRTVSVGR